MANFAVLMIAVVFVNQVKSDIFEDATDLMTVFVENKIEGGLNAILDFVPEAYISSVAELRKGRNFKTFEKGEANDASPRIQACVSLTQRVGDLAGDTLNILQLARSYAQLTVVSAFNSTDCLHNPDIASLKTCFGRMVKEYRFHITELNYTLKNLIADQKTTWGAILELTRKCFVINGSTSDIARQLTKMLKSKLLS